MKRNSFPKLTSDPFRLQSHFPFIIILPRYNESSNFQMFPRLCNLLQTILNRLNISTCQFSVKIVIKCFEVNIESINELNDFIQRFTVNISVAYQNRK